MSKIKLNNPLRAAGASNLDLKLDNGDAGPFNLARIALMFSDIQAKFDEYDLILSYRIGAAMPLFR